MKELTTELNQYQRRVFIPLVPCDQAVTVTHSLTGHSRDLQTGNSPTHKEGSGLLRLDPSLLKYLDDPIYKKYFQGKLWEIKKLEDELKLIETMDKKAWVFYRDAHCPNIKSLHSLVLHIFYWQDIYRTQILNVLKILKEKECLLKN